MRDAYFYQELTGVKYDYLGSNGLPSSSKRATIRVLVTSVLVWECASVLLVGAEYSPLLEIQGTKLQNQTAP